MSEKIVIICDPGIDGACAVAMAVNDPDIEVLALAATAGNVPAEQATKNVHILIEQLDPPRWPRATASIPSPCWRRTLAPRARGRTRACASG